MTHRRGTGRREDLVQAAMAIVRDSGFGVASAKAVSARAGMSTEAMSTYAPNLDDLLAEVFRRCAGVEMAAVDRAIAATDSSDATDRLIAMIDTFATRALRAGRLAWALLAEPVSREIEVERQAYRRGYVDMLTDIVVDGVRDGEFAPQDARITAAGIVGAISVALIGPLVPLAVEGDDPDAVIASITGLCLRAVGARTASDTASDPASDPDGGAGSEAG